MALDLGLFLPDHLPGRLCQDASVLPKFVAHFHRRSDEEEKIIAAGFMDRLPRANQLDGRCGHGLLDFAPGSDHCLGVHHPSSLHPGLCRHILYPPDHVFHQVLLAEVDR